MPDCDKFEREIRKPWRKPYRLACGNVALPDPDFVDELIRAAGQDIKTDLDCPVPQLCEAIFDALAEQPPLPFGLPSDGPLNSRLRFTKKLEELQGSSGNSIGVKLGVKASKQVCDELRSSRNLVTIRQVEDRFSEVFISQVVEAEFLSRIRDGLMKATGRGQSEEDQWESEVKEHLKEPARDLLRPAFKAQDAKAVRAPRRRGSRKWSKKQLLDPLPVVKG